VFRRSSIRRWIVRAIVVGGHVLLVAIAVNVRTHRPSGEDDRVSRRIRLIVVTPMPPAVQQRREAQTALRAKAASAPPAPVPESPVVQTGEPPSQAHVDWDKEAARVGHSASLSSQPTDRRCDDTDRPGSMLPRCKKQPRPFEWNPEPKRVGFAGVLPYVRLGDFCVLGLGFFGCAIGERPRANIHLFDELHNPDRPRSSVPDANQ
jgi:hypothetical protein